MSWQLVLTAAAIGTPAATAPIPGYPIINAGSSQDKTNTLDCSTAGDCL